MADSRPQLPVGTRLQLKNGSIYVTTGAAIGFGGGSIIYPAQRLVLEENALIPDGFHYVIKECFPISQEHRFVRLKSGEIVPENQSADALAYLQRAQEMHLAEVDISRRIYRTASRILPIRECTHTITLSFPDTVPATVANTVTIMESLSEKGRPLSQWIQERKRFSPTEAFRVIQQLLFALDEVHRAGYLHLDIQDGNLFLKGALTPEDRSELVTLIDFGSARTTQNGRTAPIYDRVIFTSPGFSAPEMLLHNDGTLQLGPEADLYSVGCLLLYMLTGQKTEARSLLANRSGTYLRPNHIRRMKCPRHLIPRIQDILGRALEQEPEKRYHSVTEMLADVTDLVAALQPYRTDLASVSFDAFICYKHGPVDSLAASFLQRSLEEFRVSKEISKLRKPFRRVFVDEGELSSCSDFGLQIREALKNSGWLIVICSTDTPLSPWVQQEIDTFLEYHDRSRILAVMTGGNETISFPPQLKSSEAHAGEILAADARGETIQQIKKKLCGDVLMKVAAPMLGVTFDTLKQRRKLYQTRRFAAAASFFLVLTVFFAAYAVNRAKVIAGQALRIEAEYRTALINESLFLAEQAERRLANSDPVGAVELALQALPSAAQDRPLVTEAELVLGKALGIYKTPSAMENTVLPVGIIPTQMPHFFLSSNGTHLFAWDDQSPKNCAIEAWDTESLSRKWEYASDDTVLFEPLLLDDSRMILLTGKTISCIDTEDAALRWKTDVTQPIAIAGSQERGLLILLSGNRGDLLGVEQDRKTPHALTVTYLRADTGERISSTPIQMDGGRYVESGICFSEDLKWVAIPTLDEGDDSFLLQSSNSLYLANAETGSCEQVFDSETQIYAMSFDGNRLAVLRGSAQSMRLAENTGITEYDMPVSYWLEAYDAETCSLLWQTKGMDYLDSSGISEILSTNYHNGEISGRGFLYVFADQVILLDQKSGAVIRQYELPAAAVSVRLTSKGFETVNADGSDSLTGFSTDALINIDCFGGALTAACQSSGNSNHYYLQNNSGMEPNYRIRKYELGKADKSYVQQVETDSQEWRVLTYSPVAQGERVLLTRLDRPDLVCLADTATKESWTHAIPEGYAFSGYDPIALSVDGKRLYWRKSCSQDDSGHWIESYVYYTMDLCSGQIWEIPQPQPPEEHMVVYQPVFSRDELLFAAVSYDEQKRDCLFVYSWNLRNGALTECFQCELDANYSGIQEEFVSMTLSPDRRQLYFSTREPKSETLLRLFCLGLEDGKIQQITLRDSLPSGANFFPLSNFAQWGSDGTQAVICCGDKIHAVDKNGKIQFSLSAENMDAVRYTPDGKGLLALSHDGTIRLYCAGREDCLNILEGKYDTKFAFKGWQYLDNHTLLILAERQSYLVHISGDQLTLKATISQCYGYHPALDRFLVEDTGYSPGQNTILGSFCRYTTEDLIQMGNLLLTSKNEAT